MTTGVRWIGNRGRSLLSHPFDVRKRDASLAVREVAPSFDAFGGATQNMAPADCYGTAGTAGTFGTAGGTLGTGGTFGTYGCYE